MSDDLSDVFLYAMRSQARETMKEQYDDMRRQQHPDSNELGERAVIRHMAAVPLKRGQMLIVGPKEVQLLMTPGKGKPQFIGHILDRRDWARLGMIWYGFT